MKPYRLFLPLLTLLLIGCATSAPTTPHNSVLDLYRRGSSAHPKMVSTAADSLVVYKFSLLSRGDFKWEESYLKAEKYNEQGYLLRRHRSLERKIGDSITRHNFLEENIYNAEGVLMENRTYTNGTPKRFVKFDYNTKGLPAKITHQDMPAEEYISTSNTYAYDHYGNLCQTELYKNDELQSRQTSRYNHKGWLLEKSTYRGDGVLDEQTLYTHNRHGDVVEEVTIRPHGNGKWFSTFEEDAPVSRSDWERYRPKWEPIESYDTIRIRHTYLSKGKLLCTQQWNPHNGSWFTEHTIEYNAEGEKSKELFYQLNEDNEAYIREQMFYNSQGLLTERYSFSNRTKRLEVQERKEYNERGELTLHSRANGAVLIYLYDSEGNMVGVMQLDEKGSVVRRTEMRYEDGKIIERVNYGKKGTLQSTDLYEYPAEGITKTTSFDKEGNLLQTGTIEEGPNLWLYRLYNAEGELINKLHLESFKVFDQKSKER